MSEPATEGGQDYDDIWDFRGTGFRTSQLYILLRPVTRLREGRIMMTSWDFQGTGFRTRQLYIHPYTLCSPCFGTTLKQGRKKMWNSKVFVKPFQRPERETMVCHFSDKREGNDGVSLPSVRDQ